MGGQGVGWGGVGVGDIEGVRCACDAENRTNHLSNAVIARQHIVGAKCDNPVEWGQLFSVIHIGVVHDVPASGQSTVQAEASTWGVACVARDLRADPAVVSIAIPLLLAQRDGDGQN